MVGDEAALIRQLIDKVQITDVVHEYSYCGRLASMLDACSNMTLPAS